MGWGPRPDALRPPVVILVDTSAWIEFLRGTETAEAVRVRGLLADDAPLACCDPIRMELLAGARDASHLRDLRGLLARTRTVTVTPADYEEAAAIYRACRTRGITVRRLIDCLIAAVAIRHETPILHRDEDFTMIASAVPLAISTP